MARRAETTQKWKADAGGMPSAEKKYPETRDVGNVAKHSESTFVSCQDRFMKRTVQYHQRAHSSCKTVAPHSGLHCTLAVLAQKGLGLGFVRSLRRVAQVGQPSPVHFLSCGDRSLKNDSAESILGIGNVEDAMQWGSGIATCSS